jgi:hypothetical protein
LGLLTENSEFHDRAGEALTLLGVSVGYRRASRPAVPDQAIAKSRFHRGRRLRSLHLASTDF